MHNNIKSPTLLKMFVMIFSAQIGNIYLETCAVFSSVCEQYRFEEFVKFECSDCLFSDFLLIVY